MPANLRDEHGDTARINRLERVFTPADTRATGGARPASGSQPELPQAFNGKLSLDAEGIVSLADGSWLISDEDGPSICRFSSEGELLGALPVAESVRPLRAGVFDYSSDSPAEGQPAPVPANPTTGRQNNQGFEEVGISPDGTTLSVALQSATRQDGDTRGTSATRDHTRSPTRGRSRPAACWARPSRPHCWRRGSTSTKTPSSTALASLTACWRGTLYVLLHSRSHPQLRWYR